MTIQTEDGTILRTANIEAWSEIQATKWSKPSAESEKRTEGVHYWWWMYVSGKGYKSVKYGDMETAKSKHLNMAYEVLK